VRLRSAYLRDLPRIEQLHRDSVARLAPAPPARLWALVSSTLSALLPLSQESLIYVAERDGRIHGFIQASGQPQARGNPAKVASLQVLNLCVDPGADQEEIAPALVDHLCQQAGLAGVHRVFVRVPHDEPLLPLFRVRGFRGYATESVLYAESPEAASGGDLEGLRSARGRDSTRLYHLYRGVTPVEVAQLEAPSYRDWRARRQAPSLQEVVDRAEIEAWWGLQRGSQSRPHTLLFMALPEPALVGRLADRAITVCDGEPAWTSLRQYDAALIDALNGRGFSLLLIQALLVRDVTLTVAATEQAKGLVPSFS
jgi:ribosomal protein S18 acetylase RimI-like enzyme